AITGKVKVEGGGKTATSAKDFTVGALPLTGSDLTASASVNGVVCLGCKATDEDNVIDSDGDNYAILKINAGVAASVSLDVKSTQTYAAGGKAGFTVTDGSALLKLSLLDGITVTTSLNGKEQENGSGTNLLGLKLLRENQTNRRFVGI